MRTITFLILIISSLFQSCLSDIRTITVVEEGASTEHISKGKNLLDQAMVAHGSLEKWQSLKTVKNNLSDEWFGFMPKTFFQPWDTNPQEISHEILLGTDNSRIRMINGPSKGDIWGIQYWNTYKIDEAEALKFKHDKTVNFVLPTIEYFFEMPFRVHEAEIITYGGEKTIEEIAYDLVFVTWGSFEPNKSADQYMVYINKDTHLIEWVQFTVRDSFGFIKASINYTDYREVNGIQVAHKHYVYNNDPGSEDLLHQYIYTSIEFGVDLDVNNIVPDPSRRKSKY